jgi:hypothetical protein
MSDVAPRAARFVVALCAMVAAVATILKHAGETRLRREAQALWPASPAEGAPLSDVEILTREPTWDLAADDAVSEILRGGRAEVSASPIARNLMLRAVAERPGWPAHRFLLASCDEARSGSRARRTLELASAGAPGLDPAWEALARADLDAWDALSPAERSQARRVFGRASRNPEFATSQFPRIVASIGFDLASSLLPEDAEVQEAAAGSLAAAGDVAGAASLLSAAERSERRGRAAALEALENRRTLGDVEGLRQGCIAWFDRHVLAGLDDAEGRRQLATLLALWPNDREGSWSRDRRGRIVRFFLDGRQADISSAVLLRTVTALMGVPDAIQARIELAAGHVAAARALARSSAPNVEEWNAFYLELARHELGSGRTAEARQALARLGPEARGACDALLLRRDIARRLHDSEETRAVEGRLAAVREPDPHDWSSVGTLAVCVDPEWSEGRTLEVVIGPGAPALARWGWDGGRSGTLSMSAGETSLRAPLNRPAGQRKLWFSFLVGGEGRTLHGLLREAS